MKECKKGEQCAILENCFCMKSDCINYYEDNCSLCYLMENKDLIIYPLNSKNTSKDVEENCAHYKKGVCELYF